MNKLNNNKDFCCIKRKNIALFLFFLISCVFTTHAATVESVSASQQINQLFSEKVTINVKNKPIAYILNLIKEQVNIGYTIKGDINELGNRSINIKNRNLGDALALIFANTGYMYKLEKGMISIRKMPKESNLLLANRPVMGVVITGKVVDSDNKPIIGATVTQGTKGAITDVNGDYSMFAIVGEVVNVSFISYTEKNILIKPNMKILNVTLELETLDVKDVIVTGFGVIQKREQTAVIETLKAEDFVNGVNGSIDQMLQGKIAGMNVMQSTSTVGAAPKIRIRGTSTILGNREPLWVLDGIVLTDPVKLNAADLNSMDQVNLIGNAISGINPEDIESINVLKDAAATALYGTKAANGVIEVITKRGKEGPLSISYSTSLSFMQAPSYKDLELMNSAERVGISQEMQDLGLSYTGGSGWVAENVGYEGLLLGLYNGEYTSSEFFSKVQKLKNLNTDWFDELFSNSFSHNHTLALSGGTGKANYRISGGYANMNGSPQGEGSTKLTFNLGLDFKIGSKILLSSNISANSQETTRPAVDLFDYATTTSRAIPMYAENGDRLFYDRSPSKLSGDEVPPIKYNVLNELEHTGDLRKNSGYSASLNLSYRPNKYFNFTVSGSFSNSTTIEDRYLALGSYAIAMRNGINAGYNPELLPEPGQYYYNEAVVPFGGELNYTTTVSENYSVRPQLNFNNFWGERKSLTISVGGELSSSKYKGLQDIRYGYLPDRGLKFVQWDGDNIAKYHHGVTGIMNMNPILQDNLTNTMGYFATAAYSYKSRYIISANIRGDASNKLGESQESQFKPAWTVSGRWNATDEPFMQGKILDYISGLSFSGSFGYQANITEAHMPNMLMTMGAFNTKVNEFSSTIFSLPNRGLLWEKTESYSLNVDFSLFKNLFNVGFSCYNKMSRDQLLEVEVSPTTGTDKVTINGGDVSNKGWDLSLAVTPINTKNFGWNISTNFSSNENEVSGAASRVVKYDEYLSGDVIMNNYAIGSYFSYRFAGLDQNGLPTFNGISEMDENGKFIGDDVQKMMENAMVYSGNREPSMSGGFGTSFRYKKFSLAMSFAYALGSDIRLNRLYEKGLGVPSPHENMPQEFLNHWKKPGDITNVPRLHNEIINVASIADRFDENSMVENILWSEVGESTYQMWDYGDHRVVNGSFLRCNSISLSYTFAKELLNKIHIKGGSVGFSMSNPFVIASKELNGKDPETVGSGSGTLPPQSSYTLSLRITL